MPDGRVVGDPALVEFTEVHFSANEMASFFRNRNGSNRFLPIFLFLLLSSDILDMYEIRMER